MSYAMASEPSSNLIGHQHHLDHSSDADADYEEDVDMVQAIGAVGIHTHNAETLGSDIDAEGEEDAEGEDDEPIAALDVAGDDVEEEEEEDDDGDAAVESASEANSAGDSDDAVSEPSTESEVEVWEGESDTAEDVEADISDRNKCMWVKC